MNKLLAIKRSPESEMMLAALIAAVISFAVTAFEYPEAIGSMLATALIGSVTMMLLGESQHIMHRHDRCFRNAFALRSAAFLFPSVCHALFIHGGTAVIRLSLMYAMAMCPIAAAVFIAFLCGKEEGAMTRGILIYGVISLLSGLAYMMLTARSFVTGFFCMIQTLLGYCILRWKDGHRNYSRTLREYNVFWKSWNAASALLLINLILLKDPLHEFVFLHYWHPFLMIVLPLILPLFYMELLITQYHLPPLKSNDMPEQKNYRTHAYLGCCFLLFVFLHGIPLVCGTANTAGIVISGICFIVMTVLVFLGEISIEKSNPEPAGRGERELFGFVACALLFLVFVPSFSQRLLPETEAPRSFYLQNKAESSRNALMAYNVDMANLMEKESSSYLSFEYGNAIGNAFAKHRLSLVMFCLCIAVLSVKLFEQNRYWEYSRHGKYAAASWGIRTALYLLIASAAVPSDWTLLPFTGCCVPELLVLSAYLFGKNPRRR